MKNPNLTLLTSFVAAPTYAVLVLSAEAWLWFAVKFQKHRIAARWPGMIDIIGDNRVARWCLRNRQACMAIKRSRRKDRYNDLAETIERKTP